MKVNATQRTSQVKGSKKTGAAAKSAGGFVVGGVDAAAAAAPAMASSKTDNVASVGALLALQGDMDPRESGKRMMARAHKILDVLDELKIAVLAGKAADTNIAQLERVLKHAREDVDDKGLASLLEQVEIRAQVEKAKLEQLRRLDR